MAKAKASGKTRAIDRSVSRAERDLRSQFAFVAKQRANIWLTATAVLFVLGIATAFVAIDENSLLRGNAGFLLRGEATAPVPLTRAIEQSRYNSAAPTSSGFGSFLNNLLRGSGNATTNTGTPTTTINNPAGNPFANQASNCSWRTPEGCQVAIEAPQQINQGQATLFKVYATPQRHVCHPNDQPSCQRPQDEGTWKWALIYWPTITVDWGDGTYQSSSVSTSYKHAYLTPGTYTITVKTAYNKENYFPPDAPATPPERYSIPNKTHSITVVAASSAVIEATLNESSPPAGAVQQNASNVEFARIDLKNTSSEAKVINALLVGCRDGYAPARTNGTVAPQPFAFNKFFSIRGAVSAQAATFSSGRELGALFPKASFEIDSRLLFKCKAGATKLGGAREGATPLTLAAGETKTISLYADVGPMDPCTRLQLGIMGAFTAGGGGPLLKNQAMGDVMVVAGRNPFTNETCGGGSGISRADRSSPSSDPKKGGTAPVETK